MKRIVLHVLFQTSDWNASKAGKKMCTHHRHTGNPAFSCCGVWFSEKSPWCLVLAKTCQGESEMINTKPIQSCCILGYDFSFLFLQIVSWSNVNLSIILPFREHLWPSSVGVMNITFIHFWKAVLRICNILCNLNKHITPICFVWSCIPSVPIPLRSLICYSSE